jgi:predicted aspartyl protease
VIRERLRLECGSENYRSLAPVIRDISVCDLDGRKGPLSCDGLVDTGADGNYLAAEIATFLNLRSIGRRGIVFPNKNIPRHEGNLYLVKLGIPGIGAVTANVVGLPGLDHKSMILGREALGSLLFVLDDRSQKWAMGKSWLDRLLLRPLVFYFPAFMWPRRPRSSI